MVMDKNLRARRKKEISFHQMTFWWSGSLRSDISLILIDATKANPKIYFSPLWLIGNRNLCHI
jgi:hypothetical protein